MGRRRIGQETLRLSCQAGGVSSLDRLADLIDWTPIEVLLSDIHAAAKGEPAWPPLALFKAMLIATWYDLSDVKLAEALDDRASFRRFCGFSAHEATPERTAFVRLRRALSDRGLDQALFEAVTRQLKAKAIRVKTGTLVDATIIASACEGWGCTLGQAQRPSSRAWLQGACRGGRRYGAGRGSRHHTRQRERRQGWPRGFARRSRRGVR